MDRIHIEKEIEEIRTPELFLAYHPNSHVFSRHYYVTQEELQQRTCKLHFHPGEIICMSRFTEATKSEVTSLIADGLSLHIQEIMEREIHSMHWKSVLFTIIPLVMVL